MAGWLAVNFSDLLKPEVLHPEQLDVRWWTVGAGEDNCFNGFYSIRAAVGIFLITNFSDFVRKSEPFSLEQFIDNK